MKKINCNLLKKFADDETKKTVKPVADVGLVNELEKCVNNLKEFVQNDSEYYSANWIRSQDYLISKKGQPKQYFKYSGRTAVMVEGSHRTLVTLVMS